MKSSLSFPTALHAQLAQTAHDFFKASPQVDTVLVVNSCARGQATPESDLDLAILVTPATMAQDIQALESAWQRFMRTTPLVQQFKQCRTYLKNALPRPAAFKLTRSTRPSLVFEMASINFLKYNHVLAAISNGGFLKHTTACAYLVELERDKSL